jgi:hypothetical protein
MRNSGIEVKSARGLSGMQSSCEGGSAKKITPEVSDSSKLYLLSDASTAGHLVLTDNLFL